MSRDEHALPRGASPSRPPAPRAVAHAALTRREWLKMVFGAAALLALPAQGLAADGSASRSEDEARLQRWATALREAGLHQPSADFGAAVARVGELALGTPYEAFTLEQYLRAGGDPRAEPLALSLTRFDCVTLVESCLAIARCARREPQPEWECFAREVERMRYRDGRRTGYLSRLHYFSEWISDNQRRGLVRDLGRELGGVEDRPPLRFMSQHRGSYPALAHDDVYHAIAELERSLDDAPRLVVPTSRIPAVAEAIRTGDVLAFATSIEGLDVTHTGLAYRDAANVLRVLHAPLSGGVVEVSETDLLGYVSAIRRATGILVARPLG